MPRWKSNRLRWLLLALAVIVVLLVLGRRHLVFAPNVLARHAIARRELAAARWWLDHARAISSSSAETEFLLARIARREGRMDDVRSHLKNAENRGYPRTSLERERWLALAQSGQLAEAEPHVGELLVDPQGDGAEVCEAFVIGFIKHRRLDRAEELLRGWAADFSDDPLPHYYLGMIEQDFGAWDNALRHYEAALQADPKHIDSMIATGKCYLEKKQPDRALEYYELAAKEGKDLPDALVGQARCLRTLGRSEEAREPLLRALDTDPEHGEANLEMAQVELEIGDFEAAAKRLEVLVQREPRNHDARFAFAMALRNTSKHDEAAEQLAIVSESRAHLLKAKNMAGLIKSPDDVDARAEVGSIYLKYGDPAEGVFWLTSVLDRDPGHKQANQALAAYYAEKQDEDPRFSELAKQHLARIKE